MTAYDLFNPAPRDSGKSYTLHNSCCLEAMARMPDCSVDSIVTDPPYHLTSIVKRFSSPTAAPAQFGTDGAFARASRGFMGKEWDGGDIAFRPETWAHMWRILKPGGHLIAFSGSRTYHRMVVAIEDAGFEIRDQLMWIYGTGFPKSHDISKAIDKAAGHWRGKSEEIIERTVGQVAKGTEYVRVDKGDPITPEAQQWQGWGSALKPAHEPMVLARKPLIGTLAENVLTHGTGGLNIDGCRVGSEVLPAQTAGQAKIGTFVRHDMVTPERTGRFPANVIHDGSDEVLAGFPKGAARFFYSAKASAADRAGSKHPTVKPVDLMRYLCRLITPPGGTVLDPFSGSGTTLQAALMESFKCVGIEREPEYFRDIERRLASM